MITKVLQKIRTALKLRNFPSSIQTVYEPEDMVIRESTVDGLVKDRTVSGCIGVILATSIGVSALVMVVRHFSWLQPLELITYDQIMRLRPAEKPDPRILLVTITEDDIRKLQQPSIPDNLLNQVLQKLESYKPRVIGVDIYRDIIPQGTEANHQQLINTFKQASNIIDICDFPTEKASEIPPIANLSSDKLGFGNIMTDEDNIVRRGFLLGVSPKTKQCSTKFSLASQLAIHYLKDQGIFLKPIDQKNYKFYLGQTLFPRLKGNTGSYKGEDLGGYQILLNYRYPTVAKQVSLTQVLSGSLNSDLVKDHLVIIGYTSPASHPDFWDTPYGYMYRVIIQAQMASQIISTVLDGRPLILYLPNWVEILLVYFSSLLGAVMGLRSRHPVLLVILLGTSIISLFGICFILFLQGFWLPVIAPAISLILTRLSVSSYVTYRHQQQTKLIILEVEKQQQAIAQLNTLLKENTGIQDHHRHLSAEIDNSQKVTGDFLLSSRYKIIQVLGSGGFGCTYFAEDTQRPGNPTCVVKQLMPARRDPKFLQVARRLFSTEAEILQALGKHNQIPELLAYFEDNQEFYLVQEYIEGHVLTEELPPKRPVQNEAFVINMLKGVLEILAFVHEYRIIHRDIKPANIIRRTQDHRFVLIDFGAVKLMQPPTSEETELSTVAIGTRGYSPPEQLAGHPRLSSDIYALGMIAIQTLTGRNPQQLQFSTETGTVIWRQWAQVSDEFAVIIDKMVRYYFSDRYQSAAEALEDLKKF